MIMKIHNEDHTYKTVMIDDEMRVGEVCEIMLEKNHRDDSILHWQIFEEPGDCPGFGCFGRLHTISTLIYHCREDSSARCGPMTGEVRLPKNIHNAQPCSPHHDNFKNGHFAGAKPYDNFND
ncbi:unnamed protein product [Taenia asiatica]|uniref:Ras-associating domain-containing protein n=1 Tax=Taenia asiatica TaxID=60517 RepID=A0A0R3WGX1_TAEAS|nr:unnamed protein product [Taenia asiatica]